MTLPNLTPRRPLTSQLRHPRSAAVVLVLAATLSVTGCSILPSGTNSPQSTVDAASQSDPAGTPGAAATSKAAATAKATATTKAASPASAADALAAKVKASLTALGNNTKSPNRGQMLAAMVDAGGVKDKVEVSIDRTPTGLAVDAIEAAAPVAKECVVGQVREGKAAVAVLPILATGLCFVGDQH